MMQIADLIQEWERASGPPLTAREYRIHLPLHEAAKIAALTDMYPLRSETEIITDLLTAALNELGRAMPYVQGTEIIARDEQNDPIYEDIGPTPRFIELCRQYNEQLEAKPR